MRIGKSIRWRIQAWHGALLLVMVAGFGITAYRLERANALRHADQELEIRLAALTTNLSQGGRPGGGPPRGGGRPPDDGGGRPPDEGGPPPEGDEPPRGGPRGEGPPDDGGERPPPPQFRSAEMTSLFSAAEAEPFYYQVWTRRQAVMHKSESAPEEIPLPVPGGKGTLDKEIRTREGCREFFRFTPPGECILVGRSAKGMEHEMRDLAWKLVGIGGGVLAFGLAVGWWISSKALQPISQISAAATRIAEGNLKERIQTSETDSELGKLASLLDDTFQRLDHAFDEQARFTSDAAHELRTPVSIILAQSQLALARERSGEEYRETITISQRAAKRMHGLIESLLQLAVLDASSGAPDFARCDLAEVCGEHLPLLRTLAEEKKITLEEDLSPAVCMGNADQLGQILVNLVINAVKFCPPESEIRVETCRQDDEVLLTVSDNGPGIAAEHLAHLFERFYRTDTSRSRASGGSGLGLAICKRIAETHDGSIGVESQLGKGSAFVLRLPVS